MRAYAEPYREDPDVWGMAGMLHDFDYEMHPRAPAHPMKGAEILLARGVSEAIVHAILAHADYSGMPRTSLLDRALYACDELTGFVHACALVRPGRVIIGLEPASVRKKLRDKAFARTVNRDDVYRGAEELGVELDQHIAFVVAALVPVASDVGLAVSDRPPPDRIG
jgi:predicted hydrolase (HD superfamily)